MEVTTEKHDDALTDIIGEQPSIDRIAAGFGFTEGPVWRGDHLLFSDIPNNRIVRFNMSEEDLSYRPSAIRAAIPTGTRSTAKADSFQPSTRIGESRAPSTTVP